MRTLLLVSPTHHMLITRLGDSDQIRSIQTLWNIDRFRWQALSLNIMLRSSTQNATLWFSIFLVVGGKMLYKMPWRGQGMNKYERKENREYVQRRKLPMKRKIPRSVYVALWNNLSIYKGRMDWLVRTECYHRIYCKTRQHLFCVPTLY